MNEPIQLIPTKSDYDKAQEYKQRAAEAVQPFMDILTEASKEGFKFQISFGENAFGQVVIQQLQLVKVF